MIAADTSSLINFLENAGTPNVARVREALQSTALRMPPPVKTEMLSGRVVGATATELVNGVLMLPISEGYWERAGESRRLIISKGLKAKLADTLIAQCCIDAGVPLIADDGDYRHFERWCGLKLAG